MQKLSVAIITFNEDQNIERCILSVQSIADEIVVVDSFSTDATGEICKRYNVKFVQHKFEGHIQQKNYVLTLCEHNLVLSLDADEVPDATLLQSIADVKQNVQLDGYSFNRLTNYCGKWVRHGSWYPDVKLRLWNKNKGAWGGINPHDCFMMHANTQVKHIKGDLLHYSYYSISQHIQQIDKFTDIGAQEAYRKGKTARWSDFYIRPIWKFIRDYIIHRGFLDGYYGFVIAYLSSQATAVKYFKIRELNKLK